MSLNFLDYEIFLLKALEQLGGSAGPQDVYPVIEKLMVGLLKDNIEEFGHYEKYGDNILQNKIRWAREYLKRKGQLDGSKKGIWKITELGKERLRLYNTTGEDQDYHARY